MKRLPLLGQELGLLVGLISAAVFSSLSPDTMTTTVPHWLSGLLFAALFLVMLWLAFGVVRHADHLAGLLGEPYGTLILTLSVISIEVIMISAVMLAGGKSPTLGRDMMFSVLMIVLNGLVGISLLLGGLKHVEQSFNLQGANTFLAVLIPLAIIGLVLPNYTESTRIGTFSLEQKAFLIIVNATLYISFLGIQTLRHQNYFVLDEEKDDGHTSPTTHSAGMHSLMLVAYMLPIIFLSKKLALIVNYTIHELQAPNDLGGLVVALLVLSPEGLAAIRAALGNNLQRSINICLGSALATIGMTIPAVLLIGIFTGQTIILGLNNVDTLLLLLTLLVSLVNFSSTRSNMIQGLVHLTLFFCYTIMIFD
ncbi:calcium:proton antiporter [Parendozoicomonas haliclonae]|uniref:Sodium/proton antiporter ChaA n=1 Tax=Parendozoicomonas haliclonae TaxID=1960125 RepID=A0A1X7AQM2_9GAMM|nr:calcium:proton antiporter [Parendozoicomonas haliclonae]SMA50596.1 Sodium/proton antiporter ChaA [Parendozoicomonas haliclonae]